MWYTAHAVARLLRSLDPAALFLGNPQPDLERLCARARMYVLAPSAEKSQTHAAARAQRCSSASGSAGMPAKRLSGSASARSNRPAGLLAPPVSVSLEIPTRQYRQRPLRRPNTVLLWRLQTQGRLQCLVHEHATPCRRVADHCEARFARCWLLRMRAVTRTHPMCRLRNIASLRACRVTAAVQRQYWRQLRHQRWHPPTKTALAARATW